MKISSEHIKSLLAYARERHGAPCRVELTANSMRIEARRGAWNIWQTVELITFNEDSPLRILI